MVASQDDKQRHNEIAFGKAFNSDRRAPRTEDDRLVRGRGCFVDDLRSADDFHLEFVRSPAASGRVNHLHLEAARTAEGIVAVFVAADVDVAGTPSVNPLVSNIKVPTVTLLAGENVDAVGQPLVAIVGKTQAQARDAAAMIEVEIADTVDRQQASCTTALTKTWSSGNVDQAFDRANHVVEIDVTHSRLNPMPLEPRAAKASWDHAGEALTVYLSTQTPHRAREELCRIFNLAQNQVRVIAPDVGGAFGGKASIHPEEIILAWIAVKLQCTIAWTASRSDEFLTAPQGRGGSTRARLAIDSDGRCTALDAQLLFPLGHWLTYSSAVPVYNAGRILPGPYDIQNIRIAASAFTSNTAAVGIYRGAGRPEAAMLLERLMDKGAKASGIDPLEFRRRNTIDSSSLPARTPTGEIVCSGDFAGLLAAASETVEYKKAVASRDARRRNGDVCGIGIGLYIEPCGKGWETARITLKGDGRFEVATGSTSQGQGRETAVRQIAGEALGVLPDSIDVKHGDTSDLPTGIGALASRSTPIGGSAIRKAANEFLFLARGLAAQCLQAPPGDIVFLPSGPTVLAQETQALTWSALATEASEDLSASVTYHAEGEAWSSGCCIAIVEIDPETGEPTIERLALVDDAGTVINPTLVEGQLIGGIAQGLGEALMEQVVYDANGQLLTGSLMDYAVPRASDMPAIDLHARPTRSPMNLLGAKGVGEAGCIGTPAAIANAVLDALGPFGIDSIDMPFTPAKIWHAIACAQRKKQKVQS